MQILITITAGASTGPFKIYGNLDNFDTPIITGLTRAQLVAGYIATVPDGTTIVRVMSYGVCFKEVDLTITGPVITTTTTTSSTSTTTTLPAIGIALGGPICKYNNCNDNASCAVVYDVVTTNPPPGSYVDLVLQFPSSQATVSLTDTSPVTATVLYHEPYGTTPVYFRLELKLGATVLAYTDTSITHQSYWPYLTNCGV